MRMRDSSGRVRHVRLTRRAERLLILLLLVTALTFGLLWQYVPIAG